MESQEDLVFALGLWLASASVVVALCRHRSTGVGLVLSYVTLLSTTHFLPAVLYTLDNYVPFHNPSAVKQGYGVALVGLVGLTAGVLAMSYVQANWATAHRHSSDGGSPVPIDRSLPLRYFVIGLMSFLVLFPLSSGIASLVAITVSLRNVVLVGLTLGCWQSYRRGDRQGFLGWLAAAAVWPLVTMAGEGFLSIGLAMVVVVWMFILQMGEFHWRLLVASALIGYILISLVATYTDARQTVRDVVWGGGNDISLERRLSTFGILLQDFAFFDLDNTERFGLLDKREGQNLYIGLAARRLSAGVIDYTQGGTLADSVLMLIPRALWPDKTVRSGGSAQVSAFTGLSFYGATSVGMGQVMEFYVNFGTEGVVVGFIILGALLRWLDMNAAASLARDDFQRFAVWFMPGLGLLQPGSNLATLTVSSVAGLVAILLVNQVVLPAWRRLIKPESSPRPIVRTGG